MAEESIAEAISAYQGDLAEGFRLLARQVENERAIRESYVKIRDMLNRPDMRGYAVLDQNMRRVYFMHEGIVLDYKVKTADGSMIHPADDAISLGETS